MNSSGCVDDSDCIVCGDSRAKHVEPIGDHESREVYEFAKCATCGHYWVLHPPTVAELESHYGGSGGQQMRSTPGILFGYARGVRMRREVRRLAASATKLDAIVDFGCGDGAFLDAIEPGIRKIGIDVSTPTIDKSDKSSSTTFVASPLPINPMSSEILPHIRGSHCVLRHVLEHSRDPFELLRSLREAGATGLTIAVPNVNSPLSRFFGSFWYYWDPPRHLHCFNRRSLEICLERAGWSSKNLRYQSSDELVSTFHRWYRLTVTEPKNFVIGLTRPTGLLAGIFNLLPSRLMKTVIIIDASPREG